MLPTRPLRIWLFAAEASPYAKVGGLGDVIGALPKALERLGAVPAIVIPKYHASEPKDLDIQRCKAVSAFDIPVGSSVERAEIYQSRIERTSVAVYLIGSRKYFNRDGIYDDPATGEGYPDNMERFIFFMKAGLELLLRLELPVDVVHCHDYHAALIPGLIQINYRDDPFFAGAGSLFTIHNLAYQGIYPKESLYYAGIDLKHFYPMSPFEFWGQVNFMKAGIEFADKVNTVSRTYAAEIQTSSEFGLGLEEALRRREQDVSGIVNGIDYEEWNPETDPFIAARFSAHDLSGKARCKEHLLSHFGLPRASKPVPLVGIVSRLADQKGFDLLEESIDEIMSLNLQLVILGTGQQKYLEFFYRTAARFPGKVAVELSFDNGLAHQVEAGCDMFLMPSKYEPCGLNQLYSFRYGTIPIVRATGGLADTVIPYGDKSGTGFSFSGYTSCEMLAAVRQALAVYSDPVRWQALMVRAMSQDWSWSRSASEYMQLYRSIYLKRQS
jgi:starch synthase